MAYRRFIRIPINPINHINTTNASIPQQQPFTLQSQYDTYIQNVPLSEVMATQNMQQPLQPNMAYAAYPTSATYYHTAAAPQPAPTQHQHMPITGGSYPMPITYHNHNERPYNNSIYSYNRTVPYKTVPTAPITAVPEAVALATARSAPNAVPEAS